MKLIKSAICYRIALPATALLEAHLGELKHDGEVPVYGREKFGFVPVEIKGADSTPFDLLAEPFEGGCAFAVRIDEKILPTAVINAETKKRCTAWCAENGKIRAPKTIRGEIREAVLLEFTQRALVKTTIVPAFYHRESRFLFVTGSKRHADILTSMLVKAVGAAKTETINVSDVKGGLTARTTKQIVDGDEGFDGPFGLDSAVWLQRGKERVTVQLDGSSVEMAPGALSEALRGGFDVTAVRLFHEPTGVTFKLTSDFHLKAISGLEVEESGHDDPIEGWKQEAGAQVGMLVGVLTDLCTMFDYKAPTDAEAA